MNNETEFKGFLKRVADEPFGWEVILLRASTLDASKIAILRGEDAQYEFIQLKTQEGITSYFCKDGDIFFVFQGQHKHCFDVIKALLYRLFPNVTPENVVFDDVMETFLLAERFERVSWITDKKLEEAKEAEKQEKAMANLSQGDHWTYVSQLTWSIENFERAKQERVSRPKKQVFVVDDDELLRSVAVAILMQEYTVDVANDAHTALAYYNRYAPDLVFLDIGLPDENGIKLLDLIMEHDPEANIVMFSNYKKTNTVKTALKKGAKGYVIKPFQPKNLLKYAHKFLGAA